MSLIKPLGDNTILHDRLDSFPWKFQSSFLHNTDSFVSGLLYLKEKRQFCRTCSSKDFISPFFLEEKNRLFRLAKDDMLNETSGMAPELMDGR